MTHKNDWDRRFDPFFNVKQHWVAAPLLPSAVDHTAFEGVTGS